MSKRRLFEPTKALAGPCAGWIRKMGCGCFAILAVSGCPDTLGAQADTSVPDGQRIVPRHGLAMRLEGPPPRFQSSTLERQPLDPIEIKLVRGELADYEPREGDAWPGPAGESWVPVDFDENGALRQRGGYVDTPIHSEGERLAILDARGPSQIYFNGQPRPGNIYGYDYVRLPVKLKPGINHLLVRGGRGNVQLTLDAPPAPRFLQDRDLTLPNLLVNQAADTWGAVIVINATESTARHLSLELEGPMFERERNPLPAIPPMTSRKVGFRIQGPAPVGRGTATGRLVLRDGAGISIHQIPLSLKVVGAFDPQKRTFVSEIDGSIQYFALRPARPETAGDPEPAIILTCHGASVEAIGQAAAYSTKRWAHLVAPTNRRPYGFDWEDFGRADAMEVLDIARRTLNHDDSRIYLTGHSMGGHGAWHLGVTFPNRFAAIGPSAGWISRASYARRAATEDREPTPIEALLRRGENAGDTIGLSRNLLHHGVYVLHGANDKNVPTDQARGMAKVLGAFHHDWEYLEKPGKGHWWSDELDDGGATCVDWPPMFDLFARHSIPHPVSVRNIEFVTANPGVSSHCYWLGIEAQIKQHLFASAKAQTWPNRRKLRATTENVAVLRIDPVPFAPGKPVQVEIDSQMLGQISARPGDRFIWFERSNSQWSQVSQPPLTHKGPHRYGAIKNELRHRFLMVYGTHGVAEENAWAIRKARFDAETFWYRGNGSIDIIADTDFTPQRYPDRTVVLYGNADSNSAWRPLLASSPVQVTRGAVQVGDRSLAGTDLAVTFLRPRTDSAVASVIAVSGSGIAGLRLQYLQTFFVPFVRFPDLEIRRAPAANGRVARAIAAGYFALDWSLSGAEILWNNTPAAE